MDELINTLPDKAKPLAKLMIKLCEEHYSTEWMQMTAYWLWEELAEQDRITQTAKRSLWKKLLNYRNFPRIVADGSWKMKQMRV